MTLTAPTVPNFAGEVVHPPGATWGDVDRATARHGLALPSITTSSRR
jgi:FAD/FMN-containing dehydrogenase